MQCVQVLAEPGSGQDVCARGVSQPQPFTSSYAVGSQPIASKSPGKLPLALSPGLPTPARPVRVPSAPRIHLDSTGTHGELNSILQVKRCIVLLHDKFAIHLSCCHSKIQYRVCISK